MECGENAHVNDDEVCKSCYSAPTQIVFAKVHVCHVCIEEQNIIPLCTQCREKTPVDKLDKDGVCAKCNYRYEFKPANYAVGRCSVCRKVKTINEENRCLDCFCDEKLGHIERPVRSTGVPHVATRVTCFGCQELYTKTTEDGAFCFKCKENIERGVCTRCLKLTTSANERGWCISCENNG